MRIAFANWHRHDGEVKGRCQKCRLVVPGRDIHLKVIPFGNGEEYRCSDCLARRVSEEPMKPLVRVEKRVFL